MLSVPASATRPTSDRVREALFSSVASRVALDGARVLDLYAGTGAVGLEALSRGAGHVLLVESDPATCALLARNVDTLALPGAQVRCASVRSVLQAGDAGSAAGFDLVFLDPPYRTADTVVDEDLRTLVERGWLAEESVVVVERGSRSEAVTWPIGLAGDRIRRYGDTTLYFGRKGGT